MLNLLDLLHIKNPDFDPSEAKVHFATGDNYKPLFKFEAGEFQEWQEGQSAKNFERKYIVSLIKLPENHLWLFAGIYKVESCDVGATDKWRYKTVFLEESSVLAGKAIILYEKKFRQSYPFAETCIDELKLNELRKDKLIKTVFQGYKNTTLSKEELDLIIKQKNDSWVTALTLTRAIYLIVDKLTGKKYVGKADGKDGGLWSRWEAYSKTGHGGNKMQTELLSQHGSEYSKNFQFSILEVFETDTAIEQINYRENYWKTVLLTRQYGLNDN